MRFDWLLPASLGLTSALVVTVPANAAQLHSWWFNARENQLIFTTDIGVQPRAQMIFNPTRIVIDLPGTTLGQPPMNRAVGGAIREVRSGQFDGDTARLVIELNPGYRMNPRDIQVRGVRNNQWVVQLPQAEQTEAPPPGASSNSVEGAFVRGLDTYLAGVQATPDGFFIRTTGEVPEISVQRRGDRGQERQLIITLPDTSISPFLRADTLPENRYSVTRWAITQSQQPQATQIALTLAPESPDWQVTTSNLGGIVLIPPQGVSISRIPDSAPQANRRITVPQAAQRPALPSRPQVPTVPSGVVQGEILVAIDPGHGGRDPGAVGIGGLQEKTVVLSISLRVAEILRSEGVNVMLTRSDDRTLDLEPRVDLANNANASVFVSIHANAISLSRPDVNGIETYYYSESGRRLASMIHANILPASGLRDRGVKQARFFVLRHTAMPAALIEVGFVTGEEDAPRLRDAAWRERMAQAIAQGILQYLAPYR